MKNNPVGRPKKNEEDKRNAILRIRLTTKEISELREKAWNNGISVSDLARQKLFD